jgi:hypothetical protein
LAACVAILALIVQMLAPTGHRIAAPADVVRIAAELKAAFGDAAVLCIQAEDGKSAPAPARDCDDSCPLCRFQSGAPALMLPSVAGLPMRIDAGKQRLGPATAHSSRRPIHMALALPRGPPLEG